MNIYHINSGVKAIIGIAILLSAYQYINPWIDPSSAIIITTVGMILVVRGVGFYGFLMIMGWLSDKKYSYLASYAYKLSFIVGMYASINRLLIGYMIWSWWIGISLTIIVLVISGVMLGLIQPIDYINQSDKATE